RTSRLLAVGLLLLLLWLAIGAAVRAISARISAAGEINRLQQLAGELEIRRLDIATLEQQLATTMSAPSLKGAVMIADTNRAALANLQQVVRTSLERMRGKLMSISEASSTQDQSVVGIQVRMRLEESNVGEWLSALEAGEPRVLVESVSLSH